MSEIYQTPSEPCPTCGKKLEMATSLDRGLPLQPQDDDFTLCNGCGTLLRFAPTGLRVATAEEMKELTLEQLALFAHAAFQAAVAYARKRRGDA